MTYVAFGAVVVGVIGSIYPLLENTDSPAGIPKWMIFKAAWPGLFFHVFAWSAICTLLLSWTLWAPPPPILTIPTGLVLGLFAPLLIRLRDFMPEKWTVGQGWKPRIANWLARITCDYLQRRVDFVEREVHSALKTGTYGDFKGILSKLFERDLQLICLGVADRLPPENKKRVVKIRHIHTRTTKLRYLLHHYGFKRTLLELKTLRKNPRSVFPTWNHTEGDRRITAVRRRETLATDTERRSISTRRHRDNLDLGLIFGDNPPLIGPFVSPPPSPPLLTDAPQATIQ